MSQRRVLGIWRMPPPIPCTRTIEQVEENFYMVSRCADPDAEKYNRRPVLDGSEGLALRRISDSEFENEAGTVYRIAENGQLFAYVDGERQYEFAPYHQLWLESAA